MAELAHVQPDDLIRSDLINDIIRALLRLDAKFDKCCDELMPKSELLIKSVDPDPADPGVTLSIRGAGFVPEAKKNEVLIGGRTVETLRATTDTIEVVVPVLGSRETPEVDVVVTNRNGTASRTITVTRQRSPVNISGIALVTMRPQGKVEAGVDYSLEVAFIRSEIDTEPLKATLTRRSSDGTEEEIRGTEIGGATPATSLKAGFKMPSTAVRVAARLMRGDTVVDLITYAFVPGGKTPVPIDPARLRGIRL